MQGLFSKIRVPTEFTPWYVPKFKLKLLNQLLPEPKGVSAARLRDGGSLPGGVGTRYVPQRTEGASNPVQAAHAGGAPVTRRWANKEPPPGGAGGTGRKPLQRRTAGTAAPKGGRAAERLPRSRPGSFDDRPQPRAAEKVPGPPSEAEGVGRK